jgi:hypothetical protein
MIVGGLLAIAVASGWLWSARRHSSSGKDVPNLEPVEELAQLRSSVAHLQHEVAMNRAMMGLQLVPSTPSAPPQEAEATSDRSREKTRAQTGVEIITQLDANFVQQTADPSWSRGAASNATRVLAAQMPPGSRLVKDVECRKSLCRAETSHQTLEQYQQFTRDAFLSRSSELRNLGVTSWVVKNDSSGLVAVSFIAKEGESVPNVEDFGEN